MRNGLAGHANGRPMEGNEMLGEVGARRPGGVRAEVLLETDIGDFCHREYSSDDRI
jgi:hypothetical protein